MTSGDINVCQSKVGMYDGPTDTDIGSECYNKFKGKIHNGIAWVVLHEASLVQNVSMIRYHKIPKITILRLCTHLDSFTSIRDRIGISLLMLTKQKWLATVKKHFGSFLL